MWFPASASVYDRDANGNIVYGQRRQTEMRRYRFVGRHGQRASSGPNIVNPVAQLETMHRRYSGARKIFSTTSLEIKPDHVD